MPGATAPGVFISEQQLQRELDLTRCRGGLGNNAPRRTVGAARENNLVRVGEIRVIENIECLGTELQSVTLTEPDPLEQGCVDIEEAGPAERSARYVPEGSLRRQDERFGIEPLVRSSNDHVPFEVRIPIGHVGLIGVAST